MGARLISLLGAGPYEAVRYRWSIIGDGRTTSQPLSSLHSALYELLSGTSRQVTSAVIIGTDRAKRTFDSLASEDDALSRALPNAFAFDLVAGADDEIQQRQLFAKVSAWLDSKPIVRADLSFAETEPPTEIVVDITHGMRAQALIVGAAVTFVLAESVRKGIDNAIPIRVVYARHDPNAGDPGADYAAPIWDLTEYVSSTLWTFAVQEIRHGRASAADVLTRQESSRLADDLQAQGLVGLELTPTTYPKRLGDALRRFADDLVFMRALALQESSKRLVFLLEDHFRAELVERVPAIRLLLDDLERDAKGLISTSENLLSREGLTALARLAEFYGSLGLAAEQSGVLREAYVLLFALEHFDEPISSDPQTALKEFEGLSYDIPPPNSATEKPLIPRTPRTSKAGVDESLLEEIHNARALRNDILHLGLRLSPQSAGTLKGNLSVLTAKLAARVKGLA